MPETRNTKQPIYYYFLKNYSAQPTGYIILYLAHQGLMLNGSLIPKPALYCKFLIAKCQVHSATSK